MNCRLEKCGSVAVLVSLWTILPFDASAMNRSVEKMLRVERNAIQRPSGLMAGPTFRSSPSFFPWMTTLPTSVGGTAAASIGSYARRIESCHSADRSFALMPRTFSMATPGSPAAAATASIRRMLSSP